MKTAYLLTLPLILILSVLMLSAEDKAAPQTQSLFDGKTLTGWKTVNPDFADKWSVVDGAITSGDGKTKIPTNTYLATTKEYGDFEFHCKFRLRGDHKTGMINSGIQYRSSIHDKKIIGYQADMGRGWWGGIYDEHRRNKLLVKGDMSALGEDFQEDGWNSYTIRCKGNHHELFINGKKTCDYIEEDPAIPAKGVIAVQIHSGGIATVEFKDLTIKEL